MRPVTRQVPLQQVFREHREAFPFLVAHWGAYCNYCERRLETHLAIEHIQPQDSNPLLALKWENFLLACTNCNSCKSNKPINQNNYLWPDRNNTLRAYFYKSGVINNALKADHPAHKLADDLMHLVGLDKIPGNKGREPTDADFRWRFRQETEDKANDAKNDLLSSDSPLLRKYIVKEAVECGGFSIWFAAFSEDADMCERLIAAYPGTARDCFASGRAIPRPHVII